MDKVTAIASVAGSFPDEVRVTSTCSLATHLAIQI